MSRIWRATPLRLEPALQPLVDQALVRGVLVDDDEAVLGLRDDVGLVDLRPRRAERRAIAVAASGSARRASAEGCDDARRPPAPPRRSPARRAALPLA